MLSVVEIEAIAQNVVNKAKSTAHVDQGSLKKSINFVSPKFSKSGTVIFRQLYYGQWNKNSQLEKYANEMMPNGVPYKIQLTTLGGDTYEVSKTKTGRKAQRIAVSQALRNSTSNIKNLIKSIQKKRKDGEKKK